MAHDCVCLRVCVRISLHVNECISVCVCECWVSDKLWVWEKGPLPGPSGVRPWGVVLEEWEGVPAMMQPCFGGIPSLTALLPPCTSSQGQRAPEGSQALGIGCSVDVRTWVCPGV